MMDMELKHKLDELETVTHENNEILRGIQRSARLQRILSIVKWVMIVIFAMAGYYVLQPFVDSARKTYEALQSGVMEIKEVQSTLPDLTLLFQLLGSQQPSKQDAEKSAETLVPVTE